jgi:hypothetical protein
MKTHNYFNRNLLDELKNELNEGKFWQSRSRGRQVKPLFFLYLPWFYICILFFEAQE